MNLATILMILGAIVVALLLIKLELSEGVNSSVAPAVALRLTPEGFEATTKLARPGVAEQWHIRQDARIWRD